LSKHEIIIVIPSYNELHTIMNVCSKAKKYGKVLVLDDCSTDQTKRILSKNNINYLRNKKNLGYEANLIKGIKYILKNFKDIKYIITLDADGELLPNNISKLINKIKKNNYDIVIGSRKKLNRFSENILSLIYKIKFNISDPISGMKIYKTNILRKIINKISTKMFLVDILTNAQKYNCSFSSHKIDVKKRIGLSRAGNTFFSNYKILKIILYVIFLKKSYR